MAKTALNNSNSDASLPLIIVNPKSASGATSNKWIAMASEVREHFGPFNVAFTKAPGDGQRIAEAAAKSGPRLIIACGGDGTINEVANGIIRSAKDAELGILPSGTGGDFRRTLGLPSTIRGAAAALRDGVTKTIDAGRVTFLSDDDQTVSRFFLNISSVGLAASVIKRVKRSKAYDWIPINAVRGKANFALSALQELTDLEPVTVRIRIDDGRESQVQTICLCVANSRYFGGGMMIAPDAKLDDGLFDIINIGDMTTLKIISNAYSLYRGTHLRLEEVKSTLVKKIDIAPLDSSHEILLETDGEIPGRLPATFEIIPKAIRVRVPKGV